MVILKTAMAGAFLSAAGIPIALTMPGIEKDTPAIVCLTVVALTCLLVTGKIGSGVAKSLEKIGEEMNRQNANAEVSNAQQAEAIKRMDELCQKIGNRPCMLADPQPHIEHLGRRLADETAKYIRERSA